MIPLVLRAAAIAAAMAAVAFLAVPTTAQADKSATWPEQPSAAIAGSPAGPHYATKIREGLSGREVGILAPERPAARRAYLLLAYAVGVSIALATLLFAMLRERRNRS